MCEQLWDLRAKRSVHTLGEQYQVLAVAFGEEGDQVYTGGIENSIKVQLQHLTPYPQRWPPYRGVESSILDQAEQSQRVLITRGYCELMPLQSTS